MILYYIKYEAQHLTLLAVLQRVVDLFQNSYMENSASVKIWRNWHSKPNLSYKIPKITPRILTVGFDSNPGTQVPSRRDTFQIHWIQILPHNIYKIHNNYLNIVQAISTTGRYSRLLRQYTKNLNKWSHFPIN